MKVLLLTKTSEWCRRAHALMRDRFPDLTIFAGEAGTLLPPEVSKWRGDLILSFVCPWILPATVLAHAGLAINFHPAPPEHPGFAPYSWALYAGDVNYGITVHHMVPRVDTGLIIRVERFPIDPSQSVYQLQQLTMHHLLTALDEMTIADFYVSSGDEWTRTPRTRQDFEVLRHVRHEMGEREINRRIRACTYPGRPGVEVIS
jgi:methionyl-tRNA formyltransferase